MKTILFQGDSITDAGRSREDASNLGFGYATLVKAHLGYESPNEMLFFNKGISGNRITDLYSRIKIDILNLKPDVISILIGVNDVWHEFVYQNGVDEEKFYKIYCMLIEEIGKALPQTKIMILEPFVLKGSATDKKWVQFKEEVSKRADKAKSVAEKYDLVFVPLQKLFDQATESASADYWLIDGVHPTAMGHELIKREWLNYFYKL